jgi:Tfp pilus assembly protein PilF
MPGIWAGVVAFLAAAGAAYCAETIELAADGAAPAVEKTATSKELALVLPGRFFRPKGESAFSTPYIAELYYTTDGGATWKSYGFFKELDKPFTFTAESEGRYGFFVTLIDQKGNSDVTPVGKTPPQITVLFDWTPPEVTLISPAGGEIIGGQKAFDVKWKATDDYMAEKPISIEHSTDGGKSWAMIAKGLDNSGMYSWTPAAGVSGRMLVRVSAADEAGHVTRAACKSQILIDTVAPTATLIGPTLAARTDVPLDVKTDDGDGSGVAEAELYSSVDNGATWTPAGKAAAAQPLVFRGTTGTYGLFATATDKEGNVGAAPTPGQAPQITLTIDTKKPLVRLGTLNAGGVLAGGVQTAVEWEAVTANPVDRPISIFISPDGGNTWAPAATDLVNSGTYLWDVPKINSSNCLLKVTIKDASGATGSAQSAKAFIIDSTKPTSAIGLPAGGAPPAVPANPVPGAEGARYQPEATPAPSEAWTAQKPQAASQTLAADASFEDVLKAAFAAYKDGQMPIAKDYFKRACLLDPKDARPHAALGRIYAREGANNFSSRKEAFEASLYEFEKAIELSGGDADTYNDMGFVLLQSERCADAANAFRKAVETGAKPIYSYNLGLALYKQNDVKGAAAAFTKAIEADPSMKEAQFFMGKISAAQGNWADARTYWGKAVDGYGPDSDMGKVALAGLEQAREKLGEVQPQPTNSTPLDRVR